MLIQLQGDIANQLNNDVYNVIAVNLNAFHKIVIESTDNKSHILVLYSDEQRVEISNHSTYKDAFDTYLSIKDALIKGLPIWTAEQIEFKGEI